MRLKVFLSYREADTGRYARDLHEFITDQLHFHCDLGAKGIKPGDHWRNTLADKIAGAHVFIPVIGKQWEHGNGNRDIHREDDVIRFEIEQALESRREVLPLLVNRDALKESELPASLRALTSLQAVPAKAPFSRHNGLASLVTRLRQIADDLQPKPLVLLSSTLAFFENGESMEGLDYFTTVITSIVQLLKEREYDVVLKVPVYAGRRAAVDAAENQRKILHEIVQDIDRYGGLIIAPFETDNLRDELVRLLKSKPRFPVATIDKAYDRNDPFFAAERVTPPPGCVCNGEINGRIAAQGICRYLIQAAIHEPNVVVLQGLLGSHERIIGFIDEIARYNHSALGSARIHLSVSAKTDFLARAGFSKARDYMTSGDWDRLNDRNYTALITTSAPRRHDRVDSFFCCNDEMALGVHEYLEKTSHARKAVEPTVVVGFDAIGAARRKIRDNDLWMLNSIDVRVMEQVRTLVSAFDTALRAGRPVSEMDSIDGELVDPDQTAHVETILLGRRPPAPVEVPPVAEVIAVSVTPE